MLWSVGPIPKETKKTKRNSQIPLTWRFVWNLFDLFFAGFSRIFAPFSFFVSWLECFPTNFSGIFPLPGISQGLASLCLFIFLFFPLLFVWLKFSPVESASFLVFHIYNSFILFLSLFCLQTLVESLLLLIFHILPMKLKKRKNKTVHCSGEKLTKCNQCDWWIQTSVEFSHFLAFHITLGLLDFQMKLSLLTLVETRDTNLSQKQDFVNFTPWCQLQLKPASKITKFSEPLKGLKNCLKF